MAMTLARRISKGIEDASSGDFDAGLTHAVIGLDTTAKKRYPEMAQSGHVGARYRKLLREYNWLIEPMLGAGVNLADTRFENVTLGSNLTPDFADIIYEIFRSGDLHGDDPSSAFDLIRTAGAWRSTWLISRGVLRIPDRLVWALLSVSVLCGANADIKSDGSYWLSLGDERFAVSEWWGREDDFRAIAARYNQVRVTLDGLKDWPSDDAPATVAELVVIQPNVPASEL